MGGPGRSWRKLHWFDWRRLVGVFINPQLLSGNNLVRISARLKTSKCCFSAIQPVYFLKHCGVHLVGNGNAH